MTQHQEQSNHTRTEGAARPITALICTRNRGASIEITLRSILENTHPNFTLVIVDQSTNDETRAAVEPFLADPRVCYLRSETKGLGRARNIGLGHAQTEIVAMTDDDCEVPPEWLERIGEAFEAHPTAAVVFCNVEAAPYNPAEGFIPVYQRQGDKLVRTLRDKCAARGIGAGLAVRREAILQLGGFDEMLGAGAEFPSCEDGDIAVRAILGGFHVYETDSVAILHYGFRDWSQGRELAKRDWFGIGAAYAKPLRAGCVRFLIIPSYEFVFHVMKPILLELLHSGKLRGFTRIVYFWQGFLRGLMTPVDRTTLRFRPRPQGR